jgi:spore maturation protein CgeB
MGDNADQQKNVPEKRVKEVEALLDQLTAIRNDIDRLKKENKDLKSKLKISRSRVKKYERFPGVKLYKTAGKLYRLLHKKGSSAGAPESVNRKVLQAEKLADVKVAAVVEDYTWMCISPECNMIRLSESDWKASVETFDPDLLLVEAMWAKHAETDDASPEEMVDGKRWLPLVNHCKGKGVPVFFWNNKEPSVNKHFMNFAKNFDCLLTIQYELIPDYKRILRHEHVYFFPFAVQPRMHHPIESFERKDRFCFVGPYYAKDHRGLYSYRTQIIDRIAAYAEERKGLDIYDADDDDGDGCRFPEEYADNIRGALKPGEMQIANKGYYYNINIFTYPHVEGRFPGRLFELAASNTVIVSDYGKGGKLFLGDAFICSEKIDEINEKLNKYCGDFTSMRKYRLHALRKALSEHLYEYRFAAALKSFFGNDFAVRWPGVTIFTRVGNAAQLERVKRMLDSQTYEYHSLIVLTDSQELKEKYGDCTFADPDSESEINTLVRDGFVGYFDPCSWYGKNYLLDLVLSTKYHEAQAVGKAACYRIENGRIIQPDTGLAYRFVDHIVMKKGIIAADAIRCRTISQIREDSVISDMDVFSIDEFNYCENNEDLVCPSAEDMNVEDTGISIEDAIRLLDMRGVNRPLNDTTELLYHDGIHHDIYRDADSLTEHIDDSNGHSYYKKIDMNIGIITDSFMYNYYEGTANYHYLHPRNYRKIIDEKELDFVFFVSAWEGLGGEREYYGNNRYLIKDIFEYAREKGVKTVFQSIEDPVHYNTFLYIAELSDYIFTSDADVVDKYKHDTDNQNVFVLEYGINPAIHNPIGFLNKYTLSSRYDSGCVFFAGTWYWNYPARSIDMMKIFDGVMAHDDQRLLIADRNSGNVNKAYLYPEKYRKYCIPAIEHKTLQKVHKLFDYSINLNTIKYSETMCAMRAYELQALGSLVLSNYAKSLVREFPNIFFIDEPDQVVRILDRYSKEEMIRMQIEGIRRVMTDMTVYDRLNYIFERSGIDHRFKDKTVYVLYGDMSESIRDSISGQTYKHIEAMDIDTARRKNPDDGYGIIFSERAYGANYIQDAVNAFKYVDCDYVCYSDLSSDPLPFNYVRGTAGRESTLFDLSKIGIEKIVSGDVAGLDGFSVLEA